MKRLFTPVLALGQLLLALMLMLTACDSRKELDEPDTPDSPVTPVEVSRIIHPVAVVGSLPGDDFGQALQQRLGSVGDVASSPVVMMTAATLKSQAATVVRDLYLQGKLIVVLNPDDMTDNVLTDDLGAGYTPCSDYSDLLVYAFNVADRHMLVHRETVVITEDREIEEEDISGLEGKLDADGELDDEVEDTADGEADDLYHQAGGIYASRLNSMVDWINTHAVEDDKDASSEDKDKDSYLKVNADSYNVNQIFNFSFHNKIAKAKSSEPDSLNCENGSVTFNFNIYPLYVFKNGHESLAGDYYLVEGTTTVSSGALWKPSRNRHGGCSNRLVGYYLKEARFMYEILDAEDKHGSSSITEPFNLPLSARHLSNVQLYKTPEPQSTIGSTNYNSSVSVELEANATGKASATDGLSAEVNAGFKVAWTKGSSKDVSDLSVKAHTDYQNRVGFTFTIKNIKNEKSWKNIDRNYPEISNSNLTVPQGWVWKIPDGQYGVEEKSLAKFFLKCSFQANYGVYQWWRGGSNGHEHVFSTPVISKVFEIVPPSRKPFGMLVIHNAGDNTIADITIYSCDIDGQKFNIHDSYGPEKEAHIMLPEGKYNVVYNVRNTATHKIESTWYDKNVEIKLGYNQEESTKRLSTLDFTQYTGDE